MVRSVPTGGVFLGRLVGLGHSMDSAGLLGEAISKPGGQQGRPHSRWPRCLDVPSFSGKGIGLEWALRPGTHPSVRLGNEMI